MKKFIVAVVLLAVLVPAVLAGCGGTKVPAGAIAAVGSGVVTQQQFDAIWSEQPFKEHPDCIVQFADQLAGAGRYGEAQDAYERALTAYGAHNCLVNTTSEFMRRYMATYGKV